MRCKRVKENLERFLDGALNSTSIMEIKEHLEACPACRAAYTEIEALKSLIRESSLPPLPGDTTAHIMAAARKSFFSRQSDNTAGISFLWWKEAAIPTRIAFVGILIVILTGGIFMGKNLWDEPAPLMLAEFPEVEAISAVQKGSIEYVYLNLTTPPREGVEK